MKCGDLHLGIRNVGSMLTPNIFLPVYFLIALCFEIRCTKKNVFTLDFCESGFKKMCNVCVGCEKLG